MKKFLSLAFVAAAFAVSVGCDDKKTSPPKPAGTTQISNMSSGSGAGAATTTK